MSNAQAELKRPCANFLLEALTEMGVQYIFSNMGTDHAPIIEELAARRKLGEKSPAVILCPHENTAIHMAGGYAAMTGQGQGVLVHVDVGTANVAAGMHNLLRSRLPVLLMAGKAPFTTSGELLGSRDTYVHFVQEPFDQGSLVRPYVKWEWTLPSGVVVKESLRRAHTIMQSEPKGPVYFMLPREVLTEQWSASQITSYPADQFGAAAPSGADPALIEDLADRLLAAKHPILITAAAGNCPGASQQIETLAALIGLRVFESSSVSNISHEGEFFCGFQPDRHFEQADVGLLVDVDVPWFPRDSKSDPATFWAQIDVDVLKESSPMWTFPSKLRIQGNSARVLEQLIAELRKRGAADTQAAVVARTAEIRLERQEWKANVAKRASKPGKEGEINPHYFFSKLGELLAPSDIVLNEAVRNAAAVATQLPRPLPGTLMRTAGGGLGASGGMALGIKLARPDAMVVQVVGDGSYYFGNMDSVLAVSRQYKLPIFVIVLDNGGWSAVKESTLRVYPDGQAAKQDEFAATLAPEVEFSHVAQAYGAHGEKLSDPGNVEAVLQACVERVRNGVCTLLHVKIERL